MCGLALAVPALIGYEDYLLFNACVAMVYLLLATGYNILLGMCGQLAMSHVAFFGIGAYASALATRDAACRIRWPCGLALLLPTACAWVMARAAVRFVGPVSRDDHLRVPLDGLDAVHQLDRGDERLGRAVAHSADPARGFVVNTPTRAYYVLLVASAVALCVAYRSSIRARAGRSSRSARTVSPPRASASTRPGPSPSRSA